MSFCRFFPRALAACFTLALLLSADANAQTDIERSRRVVTATTESGAATLETDAIVISVAPDAAERINPTSSANSSTTTRRAHLDEMLMSAIEERIGTPYRLGSTGPNRYDCSGFVWSVFQSAGISFERSSARSLWARFAPARDEEKYKFGTLVFFNHLNHVGIVADENGFYHASTSKGVVYSTFNEYWSSRVVGFRRIPSSELQLLALVK